MRMQFLASFVIIAFFLAPAQRASAATVGTTRTIFFSATGTNRTQDGLAKTTSSTCKITISNPSSVSQNYTLTVDASSKNIWNSTTTSASGSSPVTGTLTASNSITYTWTYTSYPTKATAANSRQELRCSGNIAVSDVSTPGFVIASGVLATFVESARMQTDSTTGGTMTFGGIPVFTQVPVTINGGKTF